MYHHDIRHDPEALRCAVAEVLVVLGYIVVEMCYGDGGLVQDLFDDLFYKWKGVFVLPGWQLGFTDYNG